MADNSKQTEVIGVGPGIGEIPALMSEFSTLDHSEECLRVLVSRYSHLVSLHENN